ncbi:MAG TPA: hypothetical protein VES40_14720 [Ilumatobacteraceae bacterium]|nr:hypothetical protein [Ilumatobacteraceae bacterium]
MNNFNRGDGVGIEFTRQLIRGVRLSASREGRLTAAAEVAIGDSRDDRSVVDAFVRLRADLHDPDSTTRIGTFPPASTLRRIEVTGHTGVELNALRVQLLHDQSIASTLLLDHGARRWLVAVRWDDDEIRRIEALAERAGFIDVTVEPSPVAVARVVGEQVTRARRDAAFDESFESLYASGQPVVAAAVDSVGRMAPSLDLSAAEFSTGWFEDIAEPVDLVAELLRFVDSHSDDPIEGDGTAHGELVIAGVPYPPFPPHDPRSPQRQCVALGAAVGAAGLGGRLRPIDMLSPTTATVDPLERPWVVERLSSLPPKDEPATLGPVKRTISRMLPRRRRSE